MEKQKTRPKVAYFHWRQRIAVSLLIAWYLNTPTQHKPFVKLLFQRNYQEAITFSFALALLVMWAVQKVTILLDNYCPWELHVWKRMALQFICGFCAMVLLSYLGALGYFWMVDSSLSLSDYLVLEFPLVQMALVVLNLIFICYYLLATAPKNADSPSPILKASLGNKVFYIAAKDICIIWREGKVGYVALENSKIFNIAYTLAQLEEMLGNEEFFRLNRSVMVNMNVVAGFKPVKNQQCQLYLKVMPPPQVDLVVARKRCNELKTILNRKIATRAKTTSPPV